MNKFEKIIIIIILVIIAVIIISATFRKDESKNNEVNADVLNTNSTNVIENVGNEIIENEIIENTVSNEVEEPVIENVTKVEPQGTVYETGANHGTTDKKQEAINLVKEKWGEDNTVTFRCDSVTSDGEYIIAVVSTKTASVKNYFKVNLAHQTVTIEY